MKRKLKESDCIQYKDLIKRNNHKKKLLINGFKFIEKVNPLKKLIAYGLITIGLISLPLPTGSIFLIFLGLSMLGIKKDFLKRKWKLFLYKRKAKKNNKIK